MKNCGIISLIKINQSQMWKSINQLTLKSHDHFPNTSLAIILFRSFWVFLFLFLLLLRFFFFFVPVQNEFSEFRIYILLTVQLLMNMKPTAEFFEQHSVFSAKMN